MPWRQRALTAVVLGRGKGSAREAISVVQTAQASRVEQRDEDVEALRMAGAILVGGALNDLRKVSSGVG